MTGDALSAIILHLQPHGSFEEQGIKHEILDAMPKGVYWGNLLRETP